MLRSKKGTTMMLQSPPKRRRLDNLQPHAVDNDSDNHEPPTTPRRASYLSPTKSSLARSHPHLVTRSTRRSATEPRGKTLRDELLGGKSRSSQEPKTVAKMRQSGDTDGVNDATLTVAEENTTEEQTIHEQPAGLDQSGPRKRQRTEDQSHLDRQKASQAGELPPPIIMPKLVPRKEPGASPVTRARSGSPELPPTPVALGLSAPPERPRGLASSSSPRSSRLSSGSRRRRTRSGGVVTSSPLKPKAGPSAAHEDEEEPENGVTIDDVREAPESEPDQQDRENGEDLTQLEEQQSTLQSLRNEMEQLHTDIRHLEEAVGSDDPGQEALAILRRSAKMTVLPQMPMVCEAGTSTPAYLSMFAPGHLQLVSHSSAKIVGDDTKMVHTVRVEAPEPWLPNTLCCIFEVTVDAEKAQIELVELKKAVIAGTLCTRSLRPTIYNWMNARLEHPLHNCDLGGVIWGLGIWFDATVERAKIFRRIDLRYNQARLDDGVQGSTNEQELSQESCIVLAKHLSDTQQSVMDPEIVVSVGGKQVKKKKLLLEWELRLDWAGGIGSDIAVSASGIPPKSEPGVKAVFGNLTPRLGVEGAFAHVWGLMHSENETFKMHGSKSAIRNTNGPIDF